jgi:hypothetical protein
VTRNGSPEIVKHNAPFGVNSIVTSVVTWSGGSHLVHVCVGGAYKIPVVICVKSSSGDQESILAQELEDPKIGRSIEPTEVGVYITSLPLSLSFFIILSFPPLFFSISHSLSLTLSPSLPLPLSPHFTTLSSLFHCIPLSLPPNIYFLSLCLSLPLPLFVSLFSLPPLSLPLSPLLLIYP